MANSPRYLAAADLKGCRLCLSDNRPVLTAHADLQAFLERTAPATATLLAEPVFSGQEISNQAMTSWYTACDGEATPLPALPAAQSEVVAPRLRELLSQLKPLLADPTWGRQLALALLVPSLDDVWIVGGSPVLIRWGAVPEDVADTPSAHADHFKRTLGRFCDYDLPTSDSERAGLAATVPPVAKATNAAPPPPPVPPRVVATAIPPAGERDQDQRTARGGERSLPFILGLLLTGCLIGLLLWWLRPLFGTAPGLSDTDQALLDALRQERDKLRQMLDGDVCALEPSSLPGASLSAPPRRTVPQQATPPEGGAGSAGGDAPPRQPTPEQATPDHPQTPAQGQPPAQGQAQDQPQAQPPGTPLSQLINKATVFIITPRPDGSASTGSGFFIAPDKVMTNAHVVRGGKGKILVTNVNLGRVVEGRVQKITAEGQPGSRDYALVQLSTPASADKMAILPLSPLTETLTPVIAAGFPGHFMKNDPGYRKLMQGDVSAAPQTIMTDGKIFATQKWPNGIPVIIHGAEISPGNSGGPLVDDCGRIIGINTFVDSESQTMQRGLYSLGASDMTAYLRSEGLEVKEDAATCPRPGR